MTKARDLARLSVSTGGVLADANAPSGSVIQVIQAFKPDTYSTSVSVSSGGALITGLSVSITPRDASSTFLLLFNGTSHSVPGVAQQFFWFARNGTKINGGTPSGNRVGVGARSYQTSSSQGDTSAMVYVDAPNTASAITYSVYMASGASGQAVFLNRSDTDGNDDHGGNRSSSSLIVMELAS